MAASTSRAGRSDTARRGRLVSVNVGLPKDVDWNGRTVRTGIWKSPVTGPGWSGR